MQEIWKDIPQYEGLYQVSNMGRIKSLLRKIDNSSVKGGKYTVNEKIKNVHLQNSGYLVVQLYKNGKYKNLLLHRIVAETFLPQKKNKNEVNHINGIKTDNTINNLEWVSSSENKKHAIKNNLWHSPNKNLYGGNNPKAIKVIMIDKQTHKKIRIFDSIIDAAHYLGKNKSGAIVNCCKGNLKSAYGYVWEYLSK